MPDPVKVSLLSLSTMAPGDLGWATMHGVIKAKPFEPSPEGARLVKALAWIDSCRYGRFLEIGFVRRAS
jgi:hypothetical protein